MLSFSVLYRFLKAAFFEDWILKIICLVLAVLMWFYIDGELTDQGTYPLGMRVTDIQLPGGWQLAPNHPLPEFLVQIRGPRSRLPSSAERVGFKFKKQTIEKPHPGKNVLIIGPTDIEAEGFEIISVVPKDEKDAGIELAATTSTLRKILVKTGKPKSGFLVEKATAEPTEVTVEGRTEDLEQVLNVWTEEVDITKADEDIIGDVPVAQSVIVNGKTINFRCYERVRATILIRREAVTRRMTLDVRTSTLPGLSMTVEPKSVEVDVTADAHDFDDLVGKVSLYVEWPTVWERPKDAATVLGPLFIQVKANSPAGVQIRGIDGHDLPSVKVRGALSAALGQ